MHLYADEHKKHIEISEYIITLNKVSKLLYAQTKIIEEILNEDTNYNNYTKEQQSEINKAFIQANILQDLLRIKLIKKSGNLNKNLEDEILKANRYLFKIKEQESDLVYDSFLREPIFVDLRL